MFQDLWQDLRYAARVLAKKLPFSAATALTLALGIGASTAIFGVVYGVLLKPLPFREPDRLVSILHRTAAMNFDVRNHGPATFFTYLDNHRAFEGVGVWETIDASVTGRGDPERVEVLSVSDATLPLLRVQPERGRLFTRDDDSPGRPLRVILTHGYWQRRFGGADDAVGQSLQIDGVSAEIIGVLPPSFRFLDTRPAILLPQRLDRAEATFMYFDFQVLARLRPGMGLAQANADIARMIALLPPAFARLELRPYVIPLIDHAVGNVGRILWVLLAAVGVVLLIACANVANLFLVRAEGRQQELAMRAALGASRSRIARVLLAESALLALVGGTLSLGLAQITIGVLRAIAPAHLPRVDEIGLDLPVLVFTLAISLLSGVAFGLIAVLKFGHPSVMALKEGGRSASDSLGRHRTRHALVIGQVALALTLLIVSGLMVRTVVAMRQIDPGFTRPEEVQTFHVAIPVEDESDRAAAARTYERIAERLAVVPGVASVGLSSSITMDGEDNGNWIGAEDFPETGGAPRPLRRFKAFGPGYFETMGNRLVAGRSITWDEVHARRPVIVISETLAREYWQEPARAIGRRVRSSDQNPWREIVGVAGAEHDDGLNRPATAIVYWPLLNDSYQRRSFAFAVRSSRVGSPEFLGELRQAVWSVDATLPLSAVQTLEAIEARSMAQTSFTMVMLAIAAAVALLLGVVGIYGVIAYVAAQRTREVGIRIALGAQVGEVRALFVRRGLVLAGTGIALGIGAALAATRVVSSLLFGVATVDPLTYVLGAGTLGAVALVATYLPARRASRVDPIIALRADA